MDIKDVKKNLNKMVAYKKQDNIYKMTACILRKNTDGIYYTAEILDTKHGNSVVICKLEDITECEQ